MDTRLSEAEVMAIPAPNFTDTWNPVPHSDVITVVQDACNDYGLEIISKNYTVAAEGAKMFSSWVIDSGHEDKSWMLGFRNSTNKAMAVGMTAGNNIMVCSNMMFGGEYLAFHKHTSGLHIGRLRHMAATAVGSTIEKCKALDTWHEGLKEVEMSGDDMKCITFDMMKDGVFAPSKFKEFGECAKEEFELTRDRSLYTIHGAATRLVRDKSLFHIAESTKKLNDLCDIWGSKNVA